MVDLVFSEGKYKIYICTISIEHNIRLNAHILFLIGKLNDILPQLHQGNMQYI